MSPFEPPPDSAVGRILARVSEEATDASVSDGPVSLDGLLSLPLNPTPVRKSTRRQQQASTGKKLMLGHASPPPFSRVKQFITDADGVCTGVVLDVRDYQAMLDAFGETDRVLERVLQRKAQSEPSKRQQKIPAAPKRQSKETVVPPVYGDIRSMTEAAQVLGVSRPTLYKLVKEGRVGRMIRGQLIFTRRELEAERAYRAEHPTSTGRPKKERRGRPRKG